MKGITVLGSTGSIGVSTLDVISRHPNRYKVIALTANRQVDVMLAQCQQYLPMYAVMADTLSAEKLSKKLKNYGLSEIEVMSGTEGLEYVASLTSVDYVMAAIVGSAGLLPCLAAARTGKRILLANKEALVMSGQLFIDEVSKNKAELLPIDSEHNAIFQCMPIGYNNSFEHSGVSKILLTASGGPFRSKPLEEFKYITPEQACAHPNWDMGRKISIDSATMMNKGLEVIEARWLFNAKAEDIQVVVHPQSVIHSMVQYVDGSVLAQLGNPDMRTPIAHAMAWPERIESGVKNLDIFEVARLDFQEADLMRFPCLRLAYEALRQGGTSTTILNAANEIAVDAFLNETILFTHIPMVIENVLSEISPVDANSLDTILYADEQARNLALALIANLRKD